MRLFVSLGWTKLLGPLAFALVACSDSQLTTATVPAPDTSSVETPRFDEKAIWSATISPLLVDDLWLNRYAYDAGHFLMVPLHGAFARGNVAYQREFAAHFARFLHGSFEGPIAQERQILGRLQYLYLASQFVLLAHRANRLSLVPPGLVSRISAYLDTISLRYPGGIGMRNALAGFAERPDELVGDVPRFFIAIVADLQAIELAGNIEVPSREMRREVLTATRVIFAQRVVPEPEGGWIFQPGYWTNHPDYRYAGRTELVPGMTPAPVEGIGEDVSHSHRLPLWLTSLADAYPVNDPNRCYYTQLRRGLARHFTSRVLIQPDTAFPVHRTTNYMDGTNGVYRWEYESLGEGRGYGPYQLSGTLTIGWWSFLREESARQIYANLWPRYPLPRHVIKVYTRKGQGSGNSGQPKAHTIVAKRYDNGLSQLISWLAARLALESRLQACGPQRAW